MAKKTKRQSPSLVARPQESASPRSTSGRYLRTAEPEFNPDYSYVIRDLRRIGIIAGSLLAGMLVLSFII